MPIKLTWWRLFLTTWSCSIGIIEMCSGISMSKVARRPQRPKKSRYSYESHLVITISCTDADVQIPESSSMSYEDRVIRLFLGLDIDSLPLENVGANIASFASGTRMQVHPKTSTFLHHTTDMEWSHSLL